MFYRVTAALGFLLLTWSATLCADEARDRYAVPEGDVATLVKYIEDLQSFQPTTTAEILAYRQKAIGAFKTAADRILQLEKDKTSEAYRLAGAIKFQLRLNEVAGADEKAQQTFYKELSQYVDEAKTTTQLDVALANTFCQILDQAKNVKLATEAYAKFGKQFAKLDDEELAAFGERMVGVSRRLELPGHKMEVTGETVTGDKFDWKAYRGKVVLVDYWATWCGPCVQELPNLKETYAKYHDKGFDVVGISLDENRGRLQRFLAQREVPLVCLFKEGSGWNHPMVTYYGIDSTPTTILVDREGKVVAMDLFGSQLDRQLAKMLAPSGEGNTSGE